MGRFDGMLIACDLDGTLLDNVRYEISDENRRAAEYFMREGGLFGYASGRIVSELRASDDILHTNTFCISSNGAVLHNFRTNETIGVAEYGDDVLPFLEYVEKDFPELMLEASGTKCVYYSHENSSIEHHRSVSNVELVPVEGGITAAPRPWRKLAFWAEPNVLSDVEGRLDTSLLPAEYTCPRTYAYCFEVLIGAASKGQTLLKYRELYPTLRLVCALGDNANDELMLKNADIGFAVANASDGAKRAADIVLESDCNHSALAEVVERLEKEI